MSFTPDQQAVLDANQRLLHAIVGGDWSTYEQLCDPTITCFEPESRGHLVSGMPFHRFYFELGGAKNPFNVTMASPDVRMLGDDAAVITYVRHVQRLDGDGLPQTSHVEETRVWQRQKGGWKHVHFHRSPLA
jgi:calcium/calmodulin-dependent protein kinase (CaM kinase) II